MLLNVAICTWNRAQLLDRTLTQMRELRVPHGVTWELLVVNNNCTDDTDAVIERHRSQLPLVRLFEPKQGHSNARNCAVERTRGDLLIWTDDDVLVDPDWLVEYVKAAHAFPDAGYFGGTIEPWFEVEPPGWVRRNLDRLQGPLVIRRLGAEVRPLAEQEDVFGANMAFRTGLLKQVRFDPNLGRVGAGLVGADETDVVRRLRSGGCGGVWVGTARVRHFIPAQRASSAFLWAFHAGLGRTRVRTGAVMFPAAVPIWRGTPRWLYRAAWRARIAAAARWVTFRDWLDAYANAANLAGMIEELRSGGSGERGLIAGTVPAVIPAGPNVSRVGKTAREPVLTTDSLPTS
jgi:hypothetical protein